MTPEKLLVTRCVFDDVCIADVEPFLRAARQTGVSLIEAVTFRHGPDGIEITGSTTDSAPRRRALSPARDRARPRVVVTGDPRQPGLQPG